ncbi:hypothetical protein WG922_09215 [Ramlibacter sp. AN1015]|uniref:hypothetical protein n=1 Tax=Ramlibacter sp. AN1015 TaxID=3133428 RepID=UPI0030BFA60B
MRIRTVVLILAAVLVVAFTLLNWEEVTRPTTLSLGFATLAAPLGLILLGLLGLATLAFLAASASTHTRHLMEARQQSRDLQAQRELADKAETSRFVELRQHLDNHLRESRQREGQAASETEQTLSRIQRELRQQIEQMQRMMSMRLGEMEARLGARLDEGGPGHAQGSNGSARSATTVLLRDEAPRADQREGFDHVVQEDSQAPR